MLSAALSRKNGNSDLAMAAKSFNDNFCIIHADAAELKKIAYSLRYEIFCVERGFDLDVHDGKETDEYDTRSLHFLVQHVETKNYIGVGRLILADSKNGQETLPIQKYMSPHLLSPFGLGEGMEALHQTCEISRLGITKSFLKSLHPDRGTGDEAMEATLKDKQLSNLCKLGLYRAIFDFALNHTHTPNCVFTTDHLLLRSFERSGFTEYTVMGEKIDIFGPVTPVHFNIPRMLEHAHEAMPLNWAVMTDNGRICPLGGTSQH